MRKIACLPDDDRRELFRNTADKMGLNDVIVEKDFWVYYDLYRMAQTPVKDVAFSHIDLLKTVVDFKMKFSLFGKVFLLYINSLLYVFHHFYSFFHNGESVLH